MDVLKNRVTCMNNVRAYINEIAPQIIKELEKGFSLKADCTLFKRDKERVDRVIKSKPIFRAYLKTTEYTIYLKVDATYRMSDQARAYYEESVLLWDVKPNDKAYEFTKRELVSFKQLSDAKIELRALTEQKQNISSRIFKLKRLLGA